MVIDIILEIRHAHGVLAKKQVFEKHRMEPLWKKYIIYVYDQTVNYGVSEPIDLTPNGKEVDEYFFTCLDRMAKKEVTGLAAKVMALRLSKEYGEPARAAFRRSLRVGISRKTINSLYSCIPETYNVTKSNV